ncbi:hypothetical protein PsorP6_010912 [Peronosclerospora sorghi]|uniref:Uncharacterized protein n=1 Tax=Peronosclerospora sorghi TaxID=230839 RepID=A0ACC0VTE5_9STRA|nr:hypothetical protein PsorP6_010912 [Peronosclerospora sorghi]
MKLSAQEASPPPGDYRAHTIASRKKSGGILHMGDFHDQWHLKAICLFDDHPVPATGTKGNAEAFELSNLMRKVEETYSSLAPHQQMVIKMQFSHMGSQTFHLDNTPAARPKGRPKGAFNRRPPARLNEALLDSRSWKHLQAANVVVVALGERYITQDHAQLNLQNLRYLTRFFKSQ